MVDHHVDRPGVEAQQCVKLTGTNRSIGLISQPQARCARSGNPEPGTGSRHLQSISISQISQLLTSGSSAGACRSDDLVVMARGQTPDPIPNSAVKTLSADGTAS